MHSPLASTRHPVVKCSVQLSLLTHLTTSSEGGESADALFARSAHTNQQCVALVHPHDAMHTSQMVKSVVKQHKIHCSVTLVVLFQYLPK